VTRAIHIYCDGGFGNRFNGLVAGLLIAKMASLKPIVVWPLNNWCGASYENLFSSSATVLDKELQTYVPEKNDFQFFMTEDHLNMGVTNLSPLQISSLDQALHYIQSGNKDLFFYSPLIPAFIDQADVNLQVSKLQIQKAIVKKAQEFIASRQLSDYFGVHIQKTDFGSNGSDDNGLFQLLKNCPQKQFFVCSDDAEVEARFATLSNVATYPKRAYVETLIKGGWNTPTADYSGRIYACNVNRSATSVEDAVIDLLVLSYSQIVETSKSTFRNAALIVQAARKLGVLGS